MFYLVNNIMKNIPHNSINVSKILVEDEFKGDIFMCDREKLTDATMKALQGQIGKEVDIREEDKKQIERIIENYANTNNLDEFGKMFVAVTTDEELMEILKAIISQYYNNIKSI